MDSPKSHNHTTALSDNKRAKSLKCGHSTKIGCVGTIKHDICSPKFYELLIRTELKVCTTLDINNFYNQIKMFLNAVNRLQ